MPTTADRKTTIFAKHSATIAGEHWFIKNLQAAAGCVSTNAARPERGSRTTERTLQGLADIRCADSGTELAVAADADAQEQRIWYESR